MMPYNPYWQVIEKQKEVVSLKDAKLTSGCEFWSCSQMVSYGKHKNKWRTVTFWLVEKVTTRGVQVVDLNLPTRTKGPHKGFRDFRDEKFMVFVVNRP